MNDSDWSKLRTTLRLAQGDLHALDIAISDSDELKMINELIFVSNRYERLCLVKAPNYPSTGSG